MFLFFICGGHRTMTVTLQDSRKYESDYKVILIISEKYKPKPVAKNRFTQQI